MNINKTLACLLILPLCVLCGCSHNEAVIGGKEDSSFTEETETSPVTTELSDDGKLVIFSSWEDAGKFFNRDFSICGGDSRKVHFADYLSNSYNLIQTDFSDEFPVFLENEDAYVGEDTGEYAEPTPNAITAFLPKEGEASEETLYGFFDEFESLGADPIEYRELRTESITVGDNEIRLKFKVTDTSGCIFVEAVYKGCLFQMDYDISEDSIDKSIDDICNSLSGLYQ